MYEEPGIYRHVSVPQVYPYNRINFNSLFIAQGCEL